MKDQVAVVMGSTALHLSRHAKCESVNQKKFSAEMGIHFPGLENIDKPVVWVFPEVIVCLDCHTAEFAVPEAELRQTPSGHTSSDCARRQNQCRS